MTIYTNGSDRGHKLVTALSTKRSSKLTYDKTTNLSIMQGKRPLDRCPSINKMITAAYTGKRLEPIKSVSFASFAQVVVIQPVKREDRWLRRSDYAAIDESRRQTLRAWMKVEGDLARMDPNEHTLTGLECLLTPQLYLSRRNTNQQYRQLLLEEQNLQKQCGISDPEALRELSQLFSNQSARQARLRASVGQHPIA